MWIKRFFNETNAAWQIILSDMLDHYGGALLLKSQYSTKLLELINLPPFFVQVLLFWQEMGNYATQKIDVQQILKEVDFSSRLVCKRHNNDKRYRIRQQHISHIHFIQGEVRNRNLVLHTKYYGIIRAIPQEWKKISSSPPPQLNPLPKQWFENPLAVTTKRAYRELIMYKSLLPRHKKNNKSRNKTRTFKQAISLTLPFNAGIKTYRLPAKNCTQHTPHQHSPV